MRALVAASLFLAIAACGGGPKGAPAFPIETCQRLDLRDRATGAPIVGAEDLAFDSGRRRILFSAYDRRAVEKAAGRGGVEPPEGGLYALAVEALASRAPIDVQSLLTPAEGGWRPHGIDYDPAADEVVFINRRYHRDRKRWRREVDIARLRASDGETSIVASDVACPANDVAVSGGGYLLSLDHRDCGVGGVLDDVFGLTGGGVVDDRGAVHVAMARHANGLAASDSHVFLAATRDRAVFEFSRTEEGLRLARRFELPGGPDNLALAEDGAIIVAAHPSLPAMGLARKLGVGRPGSRIMRIDLATGVVTLLFDDPKGARFSAASAALLLGDRLVAGSTLDRGLLVCDRRGAP